MSNDATTTAEAAESDREENNQDSVTDLYDDAVPLDECPDRDRSSPEEDPLRPTPIDRS